MSRFPQTQSSRYRHMRNPLVWLMLGLVHLYQWTLSPLLHFLAPGSGCRFIPSCSQYTMEALKTHGAIAGGWLALKRIARCHPWGGYGPDPVPAPPPATPDTKKACCTHHIAKQSNLQH